MPDSFVVKETVSNECGDHDLYQSMLNIELAGLFSCTITYSNNMLLTNYFRIIVQNTEIQSKFWSRMHHRHMTPHFLWSSSSLPSEDINISNCPTSNFSCTEKLPATLTRVNDFQLHRKITLYTHKGQ